MALGMTQDDLAKRLGTTRQRIIGWEKHGEQPGLQNREKLAEVFWGEAADWLNPVGDSQFQFLTVVEEITRRLQTEPATPEVLRELERLAAATRAGAAAWLAAAEALETRLEHAREAP